MAHNISGRAKPLTVCPPTSRIIRRGHYSRLEKDDGVNHRALLPVYHCLIISLALLLVVTASGTLATYAYDDARNFPARVCMGACTGIAALGLAGFIVASFLGLTPLAILLTLVLLTAPIAFLNNPNRRAIVRQDVVHA